MVLRQLAHAAETGRHPTERLPRDHDEYCATTRNLLHIGGTIACSPGRDHRHPRLASHPWLTRALAMLLDEINPTPDARRPPAHQLPARLAADPDLTMIKDQLPEV